MRMGLERGISRPPTVFFLAYFIFSVFPVGNSANIVTSLIVAIYYVLYSTLF